MDTYRENATAPKSDGSEYWAAVPTDQLLGKMQDKIQLYYSYCLSSGRADVWRRSYRLLYGWDASGTFKSLAASRSAARRARPLTLRRTSCAA